MRDVFKDIINQMNLSETEFFSELQIMDGNLGTALNLESLRSQRKPRGHLENSLGNTFMLLGASHTLWKISQAIFLHHFGNNTNCEDLEAWCTLQALGLPSDWPLAKNDFTLMLTNIKKIYEVSLIYCLL